MYDVSFTICCEDVGASIVTFAFEAISGAITLASCSHLAAASTGSELLNFISVSFCVETVIDLFSIGNVSFFEVYSNDSFD